jgi:predicted ester cyclase
MTASRNKQNYLAAKAAFNARDLDACVAHYAPDHRMSSQRGESAPSIRRFFEQTIATWPDIRIAHAVAEDNWVMGRGIAVATHANRLMGVEATQKKIETVFWDLHQFNDDGLIVETWNLMDGVSIMQQLGLIPTPPSS